MLGINAKSNNKAKGYKSNYKDYKNLLKETLWNAIKK